MSDTVSIILPCHNSGKYLWPAIRSILFNTQHPFELILVESESTDGTNERCDKFAEKYENVKVIHTPKEGITKAINKGIKLAGDNDVYLTQDDVILPDLFERDWLTALVDLSKTEGCGIVTTLNAGGVSGPSYLQGLSWVGTWSMFIPRKTINEVGDLDETFTPGPGDDIDYTYRIMKANKQVLVTDFWVDHHRKTENFNDNIEDIKRRNAEYFRKKHGLDNIRIREKTI